jgi:hypothetical protein
MLFIPKKSIYSFLLIGFISCGYSLNFLINTSVVLSQNIEQNLPDNKLTITNDSVKYQKGLEIFNQAIEIAKTIENDSIRNESLLRLIENLSNVGEMETALELIPLIDFFVPTYHSGGFHIMGDFETKDYHVKGLNAIAQGYINKGEYEKALSIIKETISIETNIEDFYINSYSTPSILKDLVMIFTKNSNIEKALEVSDLINLDIVKAKALNGIVTELINTGNTTQAKQILEQTLKIAQSISDEEYAYESNGSCNNEKFEVLSAIGTNLTRLAQIDQARKIALEVRGCAGASSGMVKFYQRDTFVNVIEEVNNIDILRQIWQESQQIYFEKEKLDVWKELTFKLIELEEIDFAFEVAENISSNINSITSISSDYDLFYFDNKENILTEIAVKFTELGREDLALKLVNNINHPLKPEARDLGIIAIAQSLKNQGENETLSSILDQYIDLSRPYPLEKEGEEYTYLFNQIDPLTLVVFELVKIEEINRIFNYISSHSQETNKSLIFDGIILGLIENNQFEEAWALIQDNNIQTFVVKDLAIKYIENNPQNLDFPLAIAQYIDDLNVQQQIFIDLIPNITNPDQLAEIIQSFSLDDSGNIELTEIIASQWVKLNKTDLVLTQIGNYSDPNLQISVINKILPLLTNPQHLENIAVFLKTIKIEDNYTLQSNYNFALNLLGKQWLKIGQFDKTLAIVSEFSENNEKISFMERIVPNLTRANQLQSILQTYQNIKDVEQWYHNMLITQIAIQMITIKEIDQAIQTTELLQTSEAKVELLSLLALKLMIN